MNATATIDRSTTAAAQTKPVIELRGIKVLASMSQETNCYEATLWVDGVKWGTVGNAGHGGCDDVHCPGRDIAALDKLIAATFEPYVSQFSSEPMTMDLELVCGEQVDAFIESKALKTLLKGNIAAFAEGMPADGTLAPMVCWSTRKYPIERIRATIAAKYPNALVINDLPESEQLAAYKRAA